MMRRGPVQPEERRPIKRRRATPTDASSSKSTQGVRTKPAPFLPTKSQCSHEEHRARTKAARRKERAAKRERENRQMNTKEKTPTSLRIPASCATPFTAAGDEYQAPLGERLTEKDYANTIGWVDPTAMRKVKEQQSRDRRRAKKNAAAASAAAAALAAPEGNDRGPHGG